MSKKRATKLLAEAKELLNRKQLSSREKKLQELIYEVLVEVDAIDPITCDTCAGDGICPDCGGTGEAS